MSSNPIQQVRQVFTRHWATTDATIDSCSWVHDHDYTGVAAGHYDVFFSYRDKVNPDQLHHGRFCRNGSQRIAPYHPGERIPIRYSPKNPDRFYPVDATPGYEKIEAILVMTLFALIAGYLLFAF
jgi:Protein of unknown function (DUF3592)